MTLRMVMQIGLVKRNNSFIWIIIVMTLFSACCHSTPSAPPDYGAVYNHVRDSLGIKLIPSDYIPEQNIGNDQGLWIYYANPNLNLDSMSQLPKAYYAGKMLRVINDSLIFESDNFGLFRFPSPSKKIPLAMLFCAYYYDTNRYTSFMNFDYLINAHPESDTLVFIDPHGQKNVRWIDGRTRRDSLGELLPMTRAEADSILATWGMKYP